MECEYCDKKTNGTYIDRAMFFCNPTCARKQAEWLDTLPMKQTEVKKNG